MRNMNCRTVRREIEETEPGELLSVAANAHVASCLSCETLSREQSKLQTIISSLGTVEAPGDFEFRLRARLAGERRGVARPSAWGSFSFGLRAAAVAMVLLMLGAAFVLVTFKTRPSDPGAVPQVAKNEDSAAPNSNNAASVKPEGVTPSIEGTQDKPEQVASSSVGHEPQKRRNFRDDAVAFRGNSRSGTRELAGTQAIVLRPDEASDGTYPTAAFPINASYQSLKVSVNDGRGASRTISVPTVTFGSQQALSQNAATGSRGVW